ncbi:hypothetical protein [Neobacillus cucumis]|uniref:hypothetical protein n=1 Tax=Neobacillus cucumis TaxID=1740721 RepID=UPI0019658682|nr:hypothetical protein [Neobacillus cucumis]MBM7654990.1 hypothetical protein [Neobacillus cucumis]MED4226300.1 hypothetical protein [Neobacillus cucumis]
MVLEFPSVGVVESIRLVGRVGGLKGQFTEILNNVNTVLIRAFGLYFYLQK